MSVLFLSMLVLILGGLPGLLWRRSAWGRILGSGSVLLAGALGLYPALSVLLGGPSLIFSCGWLLPGGSVALELDALSAFFLFIIFLVSMPAALYGAGYLAPYDHKKNVGVAAALFNGLVLSMMLVVLARNSIFFLSAWELMALASFGLVMFEHEKRAVGRAGWSYLAASQIGAAVLFFFFILLGPVTGPMDWPASASLLTRPSWLPGVLFLLAVIGFGTKAGFVPLHVWLPEAHPAAPSHVSAVMSGVMIKMGVYGLMRSIWMLGPLPVWCGWTLLGIGVATGALGVLFALAQEDIKRALAYSSVENVGIMAMGMGMGLLGMAYHQPALALLGWGGSLLHVLNHAVFKSLLFMGAGAILHETHTRNLDQLGGLLRKMPMTGAAFLVGAAAIAGLPPLNGFLGEFLLYVGAFKTLLAPPGPALLAAMIVILSLSLIGGLALACFVRLFSTAFLGQERSAAAANAQDPSKSMLIPLILMAVLCVLLSAGISFVIPALARTLASHPLMPDAPSEWMDARSLLNGVLAVSCALTVMMGLVAALRKGLLHSRETRAAPTWGCGYALPSARMQYTASSFVRPLAALFSFVLRSRKTGGLSSEYFPSPVSFTSLTPDVFSQKFFRPLADFALAKTEGLRKLQRGNVQLYILYIALTLLALLIWRLRP